jgi:hypothetical protein
VTKGKVNRTGEETRGRCRLCLKETELLRSHVLSEFLYDPTYERYDPARPKQGRFAHFKNQDYAYFQKKVDEMWEQ